MNIRLNSFIVYCLLFIVYCLCNFKIVDKLKVKILFKY